MNITGGDQMMRAPDGRMARAFRLIIAGSSLLALLLVSNGILLAQGRGHGKPGVAFDENMSPLEKQIEKSVEKKKEEEMLKPPCKQAIDNNDQAAIDKFCKFPSIQTHKLDATECPTCGDVFDSHGKVVGKRIKTRTTVEFANAGQRDEAMTSWNHVMLKQNKIGNINGVTMRENGSDRARLRQAALFPDDAVNDDKDCIDRVTGQHFGGYVDPALPAVPSNLVPDGDPNSCFDATGALRTNLTEVPGGCMHESGVMLKGNPLDGVEDDCYLEDGTFRGTSLEELIDEDGPEDIDNDHDGLTDEDPPGDADGDGNPNDDFDCMDQAGVIHRDADCYDAGVLRSGMVELVDEDGPDSIDQDGDGRVDEDPPLSDVSAACTNFGAAHGMRAGLGDYANGECDLTRAVVVAANEKTMHDYGMKMFKADDDGNTDPNGPGAVEFGQERRRVILTETYTIECDDDAELVDGQCIAQAHTPLAQRDPSGGTVSSDAAPGVKGTTSSIASTAASVSGGTLKEQVMMGFTVAPPVIKWGPKIEEYACADLGIFGEVCVEVFFARLGYEFDAAVGLRLPMELEVHKVPDPRAVAGEEATLETTIQPLDFTAKQYKDFCIQHQLDKQRGISDCDRFSFPDFFSALNPLTPPDEIDGDEFVAHLVVFAGLIVRVVGVPVISWGIDSSTDLPTMCTMLNIKNSSLSLVNFGLDVARDRDVIEALKNQVAQCGSFTTPFGKKPDPLTGIPTQRVFPISANFNVRADCAEAFVRGETVTINKKTRPICTNMLLGENGASLGIGLGIAASAGSNLIQADVSASEDGALASGASQETIEYHHSADEGEPPVDLGPFTLDNLDPTPFHDTARIKLDNFTYYLNTIQISLNANLQFGGILSPFGNLITVPIYNLIFDTGSLGIPFDQHAGTGPVELPIFVENHALDVDLRPVSTDPAVRLGPDTLAVRPGEFGDFEVTAKNLGSVTGDFDNFRIQMSNRPNQSPPYVFGINPNTDFDCVDAGGAHYFGYPYDGVPDDCYDASGHVRSDRVELIDEDPPGPAGASFEERDEDHDGLVDEDPPDVWASMPIAPQLAFESIKDVPPYQSSTPGQAVHVALSPFLHPLTAPGLYPVRILADSVDARSLGQAAVDPSGGRRLDASDISFIEVTSFFSPEVDVRPAAPSGPPGGSQDYVISGLNHGNFEDSMTIHVDFADFNQGGCNLAELGSKPACPYRAFPTAIQADPASIDWTTVSGLPASFGPLRPLEEDSAGLAIQVPSDWAGMQNTTYQFVVTGTSTGDTSTPAAKDSIVVEQTVVASPESMTRYIGLEIDALIAEIEKANADGISTGGLLPIQLHPVKLQNDRALTAILSGNTAGAERIHSANIRIVEGFQYALQGGSGIPQNLVDDWMARSTAMIADLGLASGSAATSTPLLRTPGRRSARPGAHHLKSRSRSVPGKR